MSDQDKKPSFHQRLADPVKAAFAAAAFTAAVTLTGCGSASDEPYCPPNPTQNQLKAMSDAKVRECLEEADRSSHSSYSSYHSHYIGRGYSYTRGNYSSTSRFSSSGDAFKSGSSYKSGGSSFFGSKGSGSSIS